MKLLYYLPALGGPNLDYKIKILHYNIHYIFNQTKQPFDIIINLYEIDPKILTGLRNHLNKQVCITNAYITVKKGVLTELFLTNPNNTKIADYDYILFILDDVKLHEVNIDDMIKIKNKFKIEILSPKIINSTHRFMYNGTNTLTINSCMEVYCLLMTPKDMMQFFSIHTIQNKWMWGVDFLWDYFNIKVGLYNKNSCIHSIPSAGNCIEARNCMWRYFENLPNDSKQHIKKIFLKRNRKCILNVQSFFPAIKAFNF